MDEVSQSLVMSMPRPVNRRLMIAVAVILLPLLALWGGFALWYQFPGGKVGKVAALIVWVGITVAALVAVFTARAGLGYIGFLVSFGGLLLWWQSIPPSNQRQWADDVSRITSGHVDGNLVTLNNVRYFQWRTESDYTPHWETRSYDLNKLESLDMIQSYWSMRSIAHVLISFGFNDGQHVVFSVEIRREKQEEFSEVGGFFKEFELSVIAADERDVIRLRTNVRGEDDYLYHLNVPIRVMRSLLLAYVQQANELVDTPRWYNTITVNCTTLVYHMMRHIVGHLPLSYKLLFSGYLDEYVYSVGGLDRRYPLEQLRAMARITDRAKAADTSPTFSQDIRQGIPPLPVQP